MPIIAFTNLKGGVAKTTTAVAVAECLAVAGHKTLVIDADHQCMAGELLLGGRLLLQCDNQKRTLHDLLAALLKEGFDRDHISKYVQDEASSINGGLENLSVLPCSIRIDEFETNLAKGGYNNSIPLSAMLDKRKGMLRKWLSQNYDFVLIDCPPSIPIQVRFLLNIADSFVVPCVPDRLSVRGSCYLMKRLEKTGRKIQPLGTIWSLFRRQNSLHKRTIEGKVQGFETLPKPFTTIVPNATAIAESTEPDFFPTSFSGKYTKGYADVFRSLTAEIIERSVFSPAELKLQVSR
ncbi:ParA family protein [Thalassoglobus polymorphus]|uniref:MinD/ParA/CobQ/CobA-like protein n=1 Tax=Thalassoglobus polymorphus TaxID=2527994 RepID=A0A517QTL7_9PLAN|nr:AAA family ATPase [Thalassoglobus polymorphus]QDT34986.1 MinD/ParA/CobQ/CobA-like protein [Thalassoglobus polymorphus]